MGNDMAEKRSGMIFDIQRFSIHDGPGIRTTVFLKGCPLRCGWCHNPESQSKTAELAYYPEKCIGCGSCVSACPKGCHGLEAHESQDRCENPGQYPGGEEHPGSAGSRHEFRRSDCTVCGACAESCFPGALAMIGRMATVDEVMDFVMADSLFYGVSGGGMTLSGGEPMYQPEFTLELLKGAKGHGLHTCVETCGFCSPEQLINAVPYTDLFLFDWKTTPDIHEYWTGAPAGPILRSLHALDNAGGRVVFRCPLIPDVNLTDSHIDFIAQTTATLKNISEINLEPYHLIGISKCEATGRLPKYSGSISLSRNEAEAWAEGLRKKTGIPVRVI